MIRTYRDKVVGGWVEYTCFSTFLPLSDLVLLRLGQGMRERRVKGTKGILRGK